MKIQSSDFISEGADSAIAETTEIRGATSETYKINIDGRLLFVKKARLEADNKRRRAAFRKEYEVGRTIDCPYVVKYVGFEEDDEKVLIYMEYVNGVTLAWKMAHEPKFFTKTRNLEKLIRQLAQALKVLHSRNIVHMDIKPQNIMLTKGSNDVVLVDLGFCLSDVNDYTIGGSLGFIAPEATASGVKNIDARADIYSVGALLRWIEDNTGETLPRVFGKIKNRCLSEQKKDRYGSTDDIVRILKMRKKKLLAGVVTAVACVVVLWNSSLPEAIADRIAWTQGAVEQKFEVNGMFYRITDMDERTVAITFKGKTYNEYTFEYEGGDLTIPQFVNYRGRRFKVTSIDNRAFDNPYITKITIPEGITVISDSAFVYCGHQGVIRIPSTVEKIGVTAFMPALYIDSIVVDPENKHYDSRNGCNAIIEKSTATLLAGCNKTVMPQGVKRIAQDAFCGAMELKNIDLPAGLKEIGKNAFSHSGLTEINIPEGVEVLESYAFQYCESMQRVSLPQSLVKIDLAALSHCAFMEVLIPDNVTYIGDYAMDMCERMESLTIGSGVTHIGYGAFEGCKKLKKVVARIPADKVFEINSSVFNNIHDECVLYVPRGAKKIYERTLGWDSFDTIVELN